MLRAVLLGVLAVSAGASCSKKADAPAASVGASAGKVVEITGKVDATRDGKTRTLALGGDIFRDDQIATAADGSVTIELFHNGAKWSVVSNKQARVDSSLAWGLDKQAASTAVEHNSAAAGRNAERSAADTASTTAMTEAAKPGAMQAPTAPITEAAPAAPAPEPAAAPRGGKGAPSGNAPPPPPPPPPSPKMEKKSAPLPMSDEAPKDKRDMESGGADTQAAVVITPQKMADRQRPEFQKCLDPQASKVTVTLKVRMNKTTVSLAGPGNITDKVRSCVDAVAQKIEWPIKGTTFDVVLKFD
ncbi:MAG: hypothetical protein M4D80_02245 [Myxococcota bacterium]|nr:hypothetical protein [Myxococcota bacterium]